MTNDQLMELCLAKYTEWLNLWHKHYDQEEAVVTRAMYDEYDDPPKILSAMGSVDAYGEQLTIIHIYCSPYHDEGGPHTLTGIYNRKWDRLECLTQGFDTMYQVIWSTVSNGKLGFTNTPEEDS